MADVELLPSSVAAFVEALKGERGSLDAWLEVNDEREVAAHVEAYARANVAHATAAKDAEIDLLRAERDALRDVLDRIVSYYDMLRHNERMPSMDYQAASDHENTMFGQARILLAKEQP